MVLDNAVGKISIIVPVFNVEKYIDNCIRSLVNQSYMNIEIILVDDCSTDNSYNICLKWAEKDSRIITHKRIKNGGVARARNLGVVLASGEYIAFVDSDDWVDKKFCEAMLLKLQEEKADACCPRQLCLVNGQQRKLLNIGGFNGGAGNLYKKELTGIPFPILKQGEDTAWEATVLYYKKPIVAHCDEVLYYYNFNPNSITRRKQFNLDQYIDSFKANFAYLCLFENDGYFTNGGRLRGLCDAYFKCHKYDYKDYCVEIEKALVRNYCRISGADTVSKKTKRIVYGIVKKSCFYYMRIYRDKLSKFIEGVFPNFYQLIRHRGKK